MPHGMPLCRVARVAAEWAGAGALEGGLTGSYASCSVAPSESCRPTLPEMKSGFSKGLVHVDTGHS